MAESNEYYSLFLPALAIFLGLMLFLCYNIYWTGYAEGACDAECAQMEIGGKGEIDVRGRCACFGPGTVP